jgi:hypothetical protein
MSNPPYDKELHEFADELVEMHRGTYINLFTWPKALEVVKRFYDIEDEFITNHDEESN